VVEDKVVPCAKVHMPIYRDNQISVPNSRQNMNSYIPSVWRCAQSTPHKTQLTWLYRANTNSAKTKPEFNKYAKFAVAGMVKVND